jgi:LuxR family maltose regulon positive regulatory protein
MRDDLSYSNIPIAPENQFYLERPHIYDLLEKGVRGPLVTVVAGAGYGKTRSVSAFVRKYNAISVWIQLFERDNLGWSFWGNFCRAVGFISSDTAARLREIGFPDSDQKFDRYLRVPRNYLLSGWKYIFVYDDFHLIREPAVLRFIERSIAAKLPNVSSILISRTEPGINTIPMLSKGFLSRITEDDMRFSLEETREFFNAQGLDAPSAVYDDVYRDTEGWALAVHLAALTLKNSPPGEAHLPSSVKLNTVNLIESEVVSVVSEDMRKFLIKISLIDHLTMDILSDIAGETGLLEELGRIGSFVRYDPYLHTWRVHHLFLDYLSGRQGELSEEEKRDVYIKAARWCAENNLKVDAISYYAKAGAYKKIFDILYSLPLLLPRSIGKFLIEILDQAPKSLFEENPDASLVRMWVLIALERFEEAAAGLKVLAAKLEAGPASDDEAYALAHCYFNIGLIGFVTCMYTRDYSYVRSFEKAYYYYQKSGSKFQDNRTVALLSSYLCRVNSAERGEMEQYITALESTVPLALSSYGGITYGMDDLAWAELAFFRNDLHRAEQMAYQALFKAQEKNQYEIMGRAIFYLVRINIANGNPEKIEELLKHGEALLDEELYLNRYIYYDIQTGWFYSQIGQSGRIASWIKNDFEESDLNSIAFGLELLVRAKYHYARGDYAMAMEVVKSDAGKYSLGGFLLGRIGQLLVEALCLYGLQDLAGMKRTLEEAYSLALPNGFDMPFIERGKTIQPLLTAALNSRDCSIPQEWLIRIFRGSSAYAKKLYAVAEKFRDQQYEDKAPPVFLPRREMRALVGLSRGLTRQEMAEEGKSSINTVKSIVKSLYNKLGAVNSADAVRIATSMGILKSGDPEREGHKIGRG